MTDRSATEFVKVRDVRPYEWSQWYTYPDGERYLFEIVSIKPADDGTHLWLMRENHTFLKAKPDEMLELVCRLPLAEE